VPASENAQLAEPAALAAQFLQAAAGYRRERIAATQVG